MKSILIALIFLVLAAIVVFSILDSRSGRSPGRKPHQPTRDLKPLTAHLYKDAIRVTKTSAPAKSYFGGRPPRSANYQWPMNQGKPLGFLACIDCSELPRSPELDWLPESGLLLFFYDIEELPGGFDPKDRSGFSTVYVPASAVPDRNALAAPPKPLSADSVVPKRFMAFQLTKLPPSYEATELEAAGLNDDDMEAFIEQREALYGEEPHHQVGGFADPVQNADMDEECQLVTNGLYTGDATGYNDPRAAQLKAGAKDWSLLFQMDSDDDLKVMWGDVGMLYFWVRRDDARQLKFDKTWLIMQCS